MNIKDNIAYAIWPWGTKTKEELINALTDISKLGFKYFESVKQGLDIFDGNIEELQNIIDTYGVKPVSTYFHLKGDKDEDIEGFKKKLPVLKQLGIKVATIQALWIGKRRAEKEEVEYSVNSLIEMGEFAKDFGITPNIHPHVNTAIQFEDEIDFCMEKTNGKNIGFCPDTAHLVGGKCDPVVMIKRYIDRVKFVHLKDITAGAVDSGGMYAGVEVYNNFKEIGRGGVDFKSIINMLKEIKYDGYMCIELDKSEFGNKQSAEISLKYIKSAL